jgi:hypothetical protein
MRSRLMRGEEVADDISRIEARLDGLEAKLDEILKAVTSTPVKRAANKSAPTKRKTTTKKTTPKKS